MADPENAAGGNSDNNGWLFDITMTGMMRGPGHAGPARRGGPSPGIGWRPRRAEPVGRRRTNPSPGRCAGAERTQAGAGLADPECAEQSQNAIHVHLGVMPFTRRVAAGPSRRRTNPGPGRGAGAERTRAGPAGGPPGAPNEPENASYVHLGSHPFARRAADGPSRRRANPSRPPGSARRANPRPGRAGAERTQSPGDLPHG
jgi:hypothetical protein